MIARREGVARVEKKISRRQFKPPSAKLHDVTGHDVAVAANFSSAGIHAKRSGALLN
jgi:hypothetical protein